MITTFTLGDSYCDGHGRTETITVEHNLKTSADLRFAYTAGCIELNYEIKSIDFETTPFSTRTEVSNDVMDYVASEYESNIIPRELVKCLEAAGLGPDKFNDGEWYELSDWETYEDGEAAYTVDYSDGFVRMWLEIAKLAQPDLEYSFVKDSENTIELGAYGLFH